jgi:hypothetical protein
MDDVVPPRNVRYHFLKSDAKTLDRAYHRSLGIDVSKEPQHNVHQWLDPEATDFCAPLAEAADYYKPRLTSDRLDRFELVLSSPAMKRAALCFCHGGQIVIDLTFGLCDLKLLLGVVMGIDEDRHGGVPVAFLLFSAPTGNKHTAAGHDTEVLARLLSKWSETMSKLAGFTFKPAVAITDSDIKERTALLQTWPGIWLNLCRYHPRKSWRNYKNKVVSPVRLQA